MLKLSGEEVKGVTAWQSFDELLFAENRQDVCAARVHNGEFGAIYLVWKEPDGSLGCKEIKTISMAKDKNCVKVFDLKIEIKKDGGVSIKFNGNDIYSAIPWSESMRAMLIKNYSSFTKEAKQAMLETIDIGSFHNEDLCKSPLRVTESVIDVERQIAVWITAKQIIKKADYHFEKTLYHFQSILWVMKAGQKPKNVLKYYLGNYLTSQLKSEAQIWPRRTL